MPKKTLASSSVTKDFTKYVVYIISGGGSPTIGVPQEAEIDCFSDMNERAGIIYFYPDNISLPANNSTVNGIYLYYRSNRFADVMSMLRQEKPLHLSLNMTNLSGYVGTSSEPVGEKEGV
jgi:hypothetical protein